MILSACVAASLFWGFLVGVAAKFAFGLSDNNAFFLVALPTAFVIAILLWPRLPKLFGFE